jgi:hypothetical protein
MSNLALDTRNTYSDECSPAETVAPSELQVEPEAERISIALSWLITAAASAGLWLIIADIGRHLL